MTITLSPLNYSDECCEFVLSHRSSNGQIKVFRYVNDCYLIFHIRLLKKRTGKKRSDIMDLLFDD